jgi:hypothetical protein
MRKKPQYRWVVLPPDFASSVIDCTVAEAAAFRRESIWTVFEKIRSGTYTAYKDGRITKIVVASLVRDRERALASTLRRPSQNPHPPLDLAPTGKRPVGRPRKTRAEERPALALEDVGDRKRNGPLVARAARFGAGYNAGQAPRLR